MPQTQLYLIRHGQTDWNLRAMLQGRTDIPLNETGRRQAMEAGERLAGVHFDAVYSSPLQRAMDTAKLVSGWREEKICPDERLTEIAFGPYEGKDPHTLGPAFACFFADPASYRPPQGADHPGGRRRGGRQQADPGGPGALLPGKRPAAVSAAPVPVR